MATKITHTNRAINEVFSGEQIKAMAEHAGMVVSTPAGMDEKARYRLCHAIIPTDDMVDEHYPEYSGRVFYAEQLVGDDEALLID